MFTTANHTSKTVMQQGAAFGLAAFVTFGILAGINGLATAPEANSLLAFGATQVVVAKVATSS